MSNGRGSGIMKKGSEVELVIDSAAYKGKGVGRHNGIAIFVANTAPGDRVRARIVRRKKRYREAKLLEILEPSPIRQTPLCRHADVCGGCTWQHLPYSEQIRIKEDQVKDHISRIAQLDPSLVKPIIGCDQEFYYRNKMEYSFGTRRWLSREEIEQEEYVDDTGLAAGLHAPGRFDKILDLRECHLQDPVSFQILDQVRSYCMMHDIPAFDTLANEGEMRHLVIRNSHATGELMVDLVTFTDNRERIDRLAAHLAETFSEITTIIHTVNDRPSPTATGRQRVITGSGTITDSIGGYNFRIDPDAFFQTNTQQAEILYREARSFIGPEQPDVLFDLYCGVGTLSLYMSDLARKVVGIELSDVAVRNARSNARSNGVENVEFFEGDMKDTFNDELLEKTGKPDCIITDPPRAGMHPDVIRQLKELKTDRIVYVSCNPSTMARDLQMLSDTYQVESVQPVDMFPQTWHIEAVTKLILR